MPSTLADLTARIIEFRDLRDWKQFHGLKNLFVSLNLEAAEMLELSQWRSDADTDSLLEDEKWRLRIGEESADVLIYLLLICEKTGIDLIEATKQKIEDNARKYPVEKARGKALKYTDL